MDLKINCNSIENFMENLYNSNIANEVNNRFPLFAQDLTPIKFWELFKFYFQKINQKDFLVSKESKCLVFTLIYYFLKNDSFYKSPNLFKNSGSEISLNKGLIIVGGFGVGKTSILETFSLLIKDISINYEKYPVRFHNAIEIVNSYETSSSELKNEIINKYSKGFRIFDDIKNEKEASNYGKTDVFKEILYNRHGAKNFRTILLCNYDSELPNDMHQTIESFIRYGGPNYDRIFETFNFVEFKGKSERK